MSRQMAVVTTSHSGCTISVDSGSATSSPSTGASRRPSPRSSSRYFSCRTSQHDPGAHRGEHYLDELGEDLLNEQLLRLELIRVANLALLLLQIPLHDLAASETGRGGALDVGEVVHDHLHDRHVLVVRDGDLDLFRAWRRCCCRRTSAGRSRAAAGTLGGRGARGSSLRRVVHVHRVRWRRCIVVVRVVRVDLHVVLLDVDDRLTEERVGLLDKRRCDLSLTSAPFDDTSGRHTVSMQLARAMASLSRTMLSS